jgi:NAD(P)H-dependent flavin oxidoreductase YrpB (nitropropane dioxygenase family)
MPSGYDAAVRTRFTELVGCRLPFQLAALGGVGTLAVARAVESAGGLGMPRLASQWRTSVRSRLLGRSCAS